MATKQARPRKRARAKRAKSLRYWPALALGLLLVGLAVFMWQQAVSRTFSDELIRKLPSDSSAVLLSRFSATDQESLRQLSNATNIHAGDTTAVLDALSKAGVSQQQLRQSLSDEFALAETSRGTLAVFRTGDAGQLDALLRSLETQFTQTAKTNEDGMALVTGTLKDSAKVLSLARSGSDLYLSGNPEVVKAAKKEAEGFTKVPRFAELAKQLPPGRDGYVFLQPEVKKGILAQDFPLTGAAWTNKKDVLDLNVETVGIEASTAKLSSTSGKLLAPPEQAAASIQGTNVAAYLRLLEEQRSESNIPKVLALQNGLSSLSRSLGVDVEKQYLERADGQFIYARYLSPQGSLEWMGALEFDTPEEANATVGELMQGLQQKVTIPIRKEVVTILPDGTQSREIVAEGREAPKFVEFDIEGRKGQSVSLPGNFGTAHFLVQDKFVLLASGADGVSRMLRTLAAPAQSPYDGQMAIRVTVKEAHRMLDTRHVFADWVLATRPTGGRFTLHKATGELTGAASFR